MKPHPVTDRRYPRDVLCGDHDRVFRDSGDDAVDQLRLVLLQDMAHHFRVHLELHVEKPVGDLLRIKHTGISAAEKI